MAVRTDRAVPARRMEQVIVNFDAERVAAPFVLRCAALCVDYMVVVAIPVLILMIGRMMGNDGSKLLGGPLNTMGWLIAILVGLTNLIILPAVGGQSLGKALTGIRIVAMNGEAANFNQLLRRNILGYLLTVVTLFLGFIAAAFTPGGRALHDYIAGTVVIYAQKRPARKNE
ncbi:MAG TPA: RDD family protein [Pyrinomonadaceae bacterium]|nr:RDD family protein [Pyrinomonadaceae bacterium]